jgi:hypothetical protein
MQDEDSLDEGSGGEGLRSLQSYLGDEQQTDRSADDSVQFATLWPPHQLSNLPPASAAIINMMMQPHSPATIASHMIAQARAAGPSDAARGKISVAGPSHPGSTPAHSSPLTSTNVSATDEEEARAREIYGDYVWIVQKTQANDEIGSSIQVFCSNIHGLLRQQSRVYSLILVLRSG